MIDYVEIRNSSLELMGLIDTAKSIIWETEYFGAGRFELYTAATPASIEMLQCGNYITRVESEGVGIIEAIEIVFNPQDGRMITASGRLAKSILDRRLITYVNGDTNAATYFSGNVEQRARGLVQDNAISCYRNKARTIAYPQRNISILQLGALAGLTATTEQKQVINENLLAYTDDFLRQYGYGAKLIRAGNKLAYTVYSGTDRSFGNAAGNQPVIFSEDFDNLTGSVYGYDETAGKNFALIGGGGENADRFYTEYNASLSDLARREVFVDAQSLSQEIYEDKFVGDGREIVTETDEDGKVMDSYVTGTESFTLSHTATELRSVKVDGKDAAFTFNGATRVITFNEAPLSGLEIVIQYVDDNEYRQQLRAEGAQQLATMIAVEGFEGSIDLTNSSFEYGADFHIGDIVTVQDNSINKYINVRVVSVIEVQDDNGYQTNIEFEAV